MHDYIKSIFGLSFPWQKGEQRGFVHFTDGIGSFVQVESENSMTKINEINFEEGQQENAIREFLGKP